MDPSRSVSNDDNHSYSSDLRAPPTYNTYQEPPQRSQIPPFSHTPTYNTDVIYKVPPLRYSFPPYTNINNFDIFNYLSYFEDYQIPPRQSSPSPSYSNMIPPSTFLNYNYNCPIFTAPGVPNYNTDNYDVPLQSSPIPPHPSSSSNIHPDDYQVTQRTSPIPPRPSYRDMIFIAISALNEPYGSIKEVISAYIVRNYPLLILCTHDQLLTRWLNNLKKDGTLYTRELYNVTLNDNQPVASSTPEIQTPGCGCGRGREPKPRVEQPQPPIRRPYGVETSKKMRYA